MQKVWPWATIAPVMKTTSTRPFRWSFLLLIGLLINAAALSLLATGCSGKDSGGRVYTLRGQVIELPDPANPATGLTLNHEAIDGFVDRSGEMVGMDPMSMPFPVADGLPLDGIQVGDVVEVKLAVDWEGDPEVAITEVRELPAGTKLVFREADPKKVSK